MSLNPLEPNDDGIDRTIDQLLREGHGDWKIDPACRQAIRERMLHEQYYIRRSRSFMRHSTIMRAVAIAATVLVIVGLAAQLYVSRNSDAKVNAQVQANSVGASAAAAPFEAGTDIAQQVMQIPESVRQSDGQLAVRLAGSTESIEIVRLYPASSESLSE